MRKYMNRKVAWIVNAASSIALTADATLTSALSSVTSYFTANIGTVITAVVGVVLLLWLLKIAFRSFGIRRPSSVD
jgi:beta-lactamase regulating signal transducer with metallopeptidase domain